MVVVIGSDHAGFLLKQVLAGRLKQENYTVLDVGTFSAEPVDYPDFARPIGEAILQGEAERGIFIGGSGIGEAIAANKLPGIRAGVAHDTYSARQGVEHDNMNVLALGARVIGEELSWELVRTFLSAEFTGEERHIQRLAKIAKLEQKQ